MSTGNASPDLERTPDGRCPHCGIHLNWCGDCGSWWAGSHACPNWEANRGE